MRTTNALYAFTTTTTVICILATKVFIFHHLRLEPGRADGLILYCLLHNLSLQTLLPKKSNKDES